MKEGQSGAERMEEGQNVAERMNYEGRPECSWKNVGRPECCWDIWRQVKFGDFDVVRCHMQLFLAFERNRQQNNLRKMYELDIPWCCFFTKNWHRVWKINWIVSSANFKADLTGMNHSEHHVSGANVKQCRPNTLFQPGASTNEQKLIQLHSPNWI